VESVVLLFASFGVGILASLLGIGGGVLLVPLLLLAGLVPDMASAAAHSLAGVLATSVSASAVYAAKRRIDIRTGSVLMLPVAAGAWGGARLTSVVPTSVLAVAFGAFLIYPAVTLLLGWRAAARNTGTRSVRSWLAVLLLGVVTGVAIGLLGIGGGTLLVPALAIALRFDMVRAAATSLFAMGPAVAIALATHATHGHLRLALALPVVVGIAVGAQLGPRIAPRVPERRLRQVFGLVLLYAAANMIRKGLS